MKLKLLGIIAFSLLASCTEKIHYDLARYRKYESLKPEQKNEIYAEHFTDHSGIWPEDSVISGLSRIENGFYRLTNFNRAYFEVREFIPEAKGSLLEFEALVKLTENPDNQFFQFFLQSVFHLGISFQEIKIGTTNTISGQSVLNGNNEFNKLTVRIIYKSLLYYVNDNLIWVQPVANYNEYLYLRIGRNITALVDYIKIYRLDIE